MPRAVDSSRQLLAAVGQKRSCDTVLLSQVKDAPIVRSMKVSELIQLLQRCDPDATVVICDKSEFIRVGLIRPLTAEELQPMQLGEVVEDDGRWICRWSDHPIECEGPKSGLCLGPQ